MFRKRSDTTGTATIDVRDISLRALQVFAAVDEAGSLTEAAVRLGGTRSAVSQQITNLEKLVGAPLFDRTSRPISLTPVGQIMRRHARRILDAVGEARTELMEPQLESLVEIRLGIIDDLDATIAPDLVTDLRNRYPRSQVTVTSGRSDDLCDALAQRRVDLILTGFVPDPMAGYEELRILREPFMVVAPKGLLDPGGDLRAQMQERTFVRYNANMPIGRAIAQHLRRLRIELSAPFSFDASRSVFAMMTKCGGWTISTPLCLLDAGQAAAGMDCLRLPFPGLERTIRIVTRGGELGRLPLHMADLARQLIRSRVVPDVASLGGWLRDEFVLLANRGEPVSADASVPSEGGS